MLPSAEVVDLSRLQFGATALYHFLFVPLTLGLSWILVIMGIQGSARKSDGSIDSRQYIHGVLIAANQDA